MRRVAHGFTLVEILVVMGLMAILGTMAFTNLIRPQNQASLDSIVTTLLADLKSQQIKAISGDSLSAATAQAHGIYVQNSNYTLFKGSSYSGSDTDNFVVSVDTGLTLSTTFPTSQVVFTKGSGDVTGFTAGQNTITVTSSSTGSKVITLNRYGAVTVN